MSSAPRNVDVSLSTGVTIIWDDGHASHFAVPELRAACPCATCQDLHGNGETPTAVPTPAPSLLPMYQPRGATLVSVQSVGHYALRFVFSDQHNTGIFTWEYLRSLCTCVSCKANPAFSPT
jgi:DUF971 family protein